MIINKQKVRDAKNEFKSISYNLNMINSKTEIAKSYNNFYNVLKNCKSFSHLLITLANYKDLCEMLGNWNDTDEFIFENVKTIIFCCMKGTEEERLINAIEYLKD